MLLFNNIRLAILPSIILAATGFWFVASMSEFQQTTSPIFVFAGNDTVTCSGQTLALSDLNGTITGAVNNGYWFTTGDGVFLPGNQKNVLFSVGTHYVPGTADISTGKYKLLLTSDDPDLDPVSGVNGPLLQVTDDIQVSFQPPPPLFCNNNLNISLDAQCQQLVDITILQSNPVQPFSHYIITLQDKNGQVIPQNIVTGQHIGQEISFSIGHACTQNICWGKFIVSDYFPPVFQCRNDTLLCFRSSLPDSVGFPIPPTAVIDTFLNGKYIVSNWDACGKVNLEFKDQLISGNCIADIDRTIRRTWKAVDASGNVSNCIQEIVFKRLPLAQVIFPPHYDDHQLSAFECQDSFPRLVNGYPAPDTTGRPLIGGCTHLKASFTDTEFELCGNTFKIARSWFVIDWCSTESVLRNQLILVRDSRGPVFSCPDSLVFFASAYQCATGPELLPPPDSVSDCSAWNYNVRIKNISGQSLPQFVQTAGQHFRLINLPVGQYILIYTLTDSCGNSSTCDVPVSIRDNLTPYAVCDQITKVALGQNGVGRVLASTLDDGSTDNCGIHSFKVRKLTDGCGFGTAFGDFVDFCCNEIGQNNMVALQVTDIHGNSNTCMVEVWVEDKILPVITCPPHITIACTTTVDYNNLNAFGKVETLQSQVQPIILNDFYNYGNIGNDGLASDNCSVTITTHYQQNINCFEGNIIRTFVATDPDGRQDSCTQIITVRNPSPFNQNNIIWPANFNGEGCHQNQASPDITGKPVFSNTSCSLVAATYEDQKFFFADSACVKIIRSWTVIDWCQFNEITSFGKWGPYTQVIKLSNFTAPVFETACTDTVLCSYDTECKTGWVDLFQNASDDCTERSALTWSYLLDLYNNQSIDSIGNTNHLAAFLPLGTHSITWIVSDGCGNSSTCIQQFTVKDCKKPTPYCITSVTVPLMQPAGMAEIWAKDYDLGSFDNCTPSDSLIFSFSSQTTDNFRTFTCADIPDGRSEKIQLTMYVTDKQGNQDFCSVEIILQDNAGLCPDIISSAYVDGYVRTESGLIPSGVQVHFRSVIEENTGTTPTDNFGYYHFDELATGHQYVLKPHLAADPVRGLTTFDLVLIQRHILGLQELDSPYKVIAADANFTNSVTAADLVELRKLILGIANRFPKGKNAWQFVDKNHVFSDHNNPWFAPDSILLNVTEREHLMNDFVAVKMGDVNDSYTNLTNEEIIESRSGKPIIVNYQRVLRDGQQRLLFSMDTPEQVDGLQMSVTCVDAVRQSTFSSSMDVSGIFSTNEGFYCNASLRLLAYSENTKHIDAKQTILEVDIPQIQAECLLELDQSFNSEIYIEGTGRKIELREINPEPNFAGLKILTNPALHELNFHLGSEHIDDYGFNYLILDNQGKEVMSGRMPKNYSYQEYSLPFNLSMPSGVYYLSIPGTNLPALKFIRIAH